MSTQNDDQWRITVDVPLSLPHETRHYLLDRINASLGDWLLSFEERSWDPFLSAGAADHSLEAYADRLEEQLEQARQRLADAEERLHALRTAPRHRLRQPSQAEMDVMAQQALEQMP